MITEEEAIDAADEILLQFGQTHVDLLHQTEENALTLAQWVGQHLIGREIDRIERAKPITAEWLESIGFQVPKPSGFFSADTPDGDVSVFFDNGTLDEVQINWSSLRHIATRGQLDDLLKLLKGGEP